MLRFPSPRRRQAWNCLGPESRDLQESTVSSMSSRSGVPVRRPWPKLPGLDLNLYVDMRSFLPEDTTSPPKAARPKARARMATEARRGHSVAFSSVGLGHFRV